MYYLIALAVIIALQREAEHEAEWRQYCSDRRMPPHGSIHKTTMFFLDHSAAINAIPLGKPDRPNWKAYPFFPGLNGYHR
ncbi:MAG: hypothetical protein HY010_12110, partial [Acidobacteria bacterium]|nr:hypothetical protein [Acidobacteriota bacterium]